MRTVYLLLLSLLIASPLFSQDPREMRLVGEPVKLDSEMVARRDINGNYCAAIQVISDMDGFAYDAFDGVVGDVDSRPGLDIVFLTTGERVLEIYQRGYQPLKLILSEHGIRLRPREVWQITVAGDAPLAQTLPVTIRITPADARLTINGNRVSNTGTHPLVPGNHSVRVEKEGFKTEQRTIAVSEQQVFFEFVLQRQPDAGLQIETTPSGATVYLDGVLLGETPLAVFYKPGTYPIRIVKDGYVTLENQTLEVTMPQTRKSYTLEENVGYLTINTHSGASVYFNDRLIANPRNVKLPPQLVSVKVTMPKAEPLEQQVVLKRNERLTLDMFPTVQTGTIQIAVTPFDANIELTGDAGEKFTATGMKVFEDIPVGTYNVKVTASGFHAEKKRIVLQPNLIKELVIRLEEDHLDNISSIEGTNLNIRKNDEKSQKNETSFSILGGLGIAHTLHRNDSLNYSSKYGYQAVVSGLFGFRVNYKLSDDFSLRSGMHYNLKGYKASRVDNLSGDFTRKLQIHYIMLPVLLVIDINRFNDGSNYRNIFLGLEVGIALSGNKQVLNQEEFKAKVTWGQGVDDFQRFDFGLNAGFVYKYPKLANFEFEFSLSCLRSSISNDKKFNNIQTNLTFNAALIYWF